MGTSSPQHFLEIDDLSHDAIIDVLDRAEMKSPSACLDRQTFALVFEKPSLRTRHSMESAIYELGGHPVYTHPDEIGIDTRESAEDIAQALSGFHAGIAARVFSHDKLVRMAAASSVPVINLLSDRTHPIQTLADLLTIRQNFSRLDDLTIAYVGDANNVSFPLGIAAHMFGSRMIISHPEGYGFNDNDQNEFRARNITIENIEDPKDAVAKADVVYTDAWYSMGQEEQAAQREKAFADFQINDDLMSHTKESAIFMHCLPAHRGHEVTDSVLDGPQSRIWPQAHNRRYSARGLLSHIYS